MEQFRMDQPQMSKNYREVTVFSADAYYKEILRAQRGFKSVSYAINDTEDIHSCLVVKDGYIVEKVTVKLN